VSAFLHSIIGRPVFSRSAITAAAVIAAIILCPHVVSGFVMKSKDEMTIRMYGAMFGIKSHRVIRSRKAEHRTVNR
jgi:hypothetical protein